MDERLVRAFPFLGNAEPAVRRELERHALSARLADGAAIGSEGERCAHLALLLSGGARVFKVGETGREITLYRLEPGDSCILTTSCILSDREFPAEAVAVGATEALLVPAPVFRRWVEDFPIWRAYAFDLVARRLADIIAIVEEVAFRRLDARLAEYLSHAVDVSSTSTTLHTTHEQIASELGSSREVISRLLKELEREGVVSLARGAIDVLDSSALVRVHR